MSDISPTTGSKGLIDRLMVEIQIIVRAFMILFKISGGRMLTVMVGPELFYFFIFLFYFELRLFLGLAADGTSAASAVIAGLTQPGKWWMGTDGFSFKDAGCNMMGLN